MPLFNRSRALLHAFLASEAAGGLVLMAAAALAMIVANSQLSHGYFETLHAHAGALTVHEWVNDGLMAIFFLLVGLEIKREAAEGELATWSARILPGVCAGAGMAVPALIYIGLNAGDAHTLRGWAIPAATDIAFALAVLSLCGKGVPHSLKVFLAALAIIDDLGAVIAIAVFYTSTLSLPFLLVSAAIIAVLIALNRFGIRSLWPYLILGAVLWWAVLQSGVHATLAGVALALTIPLHNKTGSAAHAGPLHTLEHALHKPVAFLIVPVFGFANAGLSFGGLSPATLLEPVPLGVATGLLVGKTLGVFGAAALLIAAGLARKPEGSSWRQLFGVAVLCGVGFTMSLFIGALAFVEPHLQELAKLGTVAGSLVAGLIGYGFLRSQRPT